MGKEHLCCDSCVYWEPSCSGGVGVCRLFGIESGPQNDACPAWDVKLVEEGLDIQVEVDP